MSPTGLVSTIPVYPLVLKFITHEVGSGPLLLTANGNKFGFFLYACLDRYSYPDKRLPKRYHRLSCQLPIEMPAWLPHSGHGTKLTPQKIAVFNDFAQQLFFEQMTREVTTRMEFGCGMRESVQRFLNLYGVTEDDLPLDTALRYYARYQRRLKKTPDCCPVTPAIPSVILSHDSDRAYGQVESRGRAVA